MKYDLSKNAKKNIVSGLANRIIALVIPFIVQTVIIKKIGIDYIGINGLFSSILTILNMAELGIGSAIVFSLYKPIAENDQNTINGLLNLYRKIYFCIGLFIFVIGLILLPFVPKLIKGDYPNDINIFIVYILFLIKTGISYWLFSYKSCIFNATQRTDILNKASSYSYMLIGIIQIILIFVTQNYYVYLSLSIVIVLTNNLIINHYSKKKYILNTYAKEMCLLS